VFFPLAWNVFPQGEKSLDKGQTFKWNFSLCTEKHSKQGEKISIPQHCNFVSSQTQG